MSSVFAVTHRLIEGGDEDRAGRLKAAVWALSPAKPLFDELPGVAVFHHEGTSQSVLEQLCEAVAWRPGDALLVINLSRAEYAQRGAATVERLDYVMDLRARALAPA